MAACTVGQEGTIYVEGYENEDSVLNLSIGTPNYSDYTVVHVKNDVTESMPLEESMISDYDRMKFYQIGTYEITITAYDCECTININIVRNNFSDITLNGSMVTYDGKAHSLSFNKSLPSGTVVTYDIGNSFTDVGTYVVTATLVNDSYVTYKTTGTLIIKKAEYDMSGISFSDSTVTYDGKYKSIEIEGSLPTGVSVSYSIEGYTSARVINAGTYIVTATFTNTNKNYEDVESMTATLTIEKGTIDVSELLFPDTKTLYDGTPKRIKIVGDVPDGVDVSYDVISVETGEHLDYRTITDVGTYYFFAYLDVDTTNYNTINPLFAVLTIYSE
ncbi:MAG: MBG domain-containing protein [Acholeplasmatales bacterium]|nr:MBG domain-containing protein [Acholeplasmatales bacterium]